MKYRQLGKSGLRVPVISLGTGTFGGIGPLFGHWGTTDAAEGRRLVDICLEVGACMFDSADVYSAGAAERVLGKQSKVAAKSRLDIHENRIADGRGAKRGGHVTCANHQVRRAVPRIPAS